MPMAILLILLGSIMFLFLIDRLLHGWLVFSMERWSRQMSLRDIRLRGHAAHSQIWSRYAEIPPEGEG